MSGLSRLYLFLYFETATIMRRFHGRYYFYISVIFTIILVRPFLLFCLDVLFDASGLMSCPNCSTESENQDSFPLRIHQIYFNVSKSNSLYLKLKDARESWSRLNRQFEYKLWDEAMVEELIRDKYPHMKELYKSFSRWIQKVDMAKYLILHQYGGIYADIDIECVKNMKEVYETFPKYTGVVMYYTKPFGVATDFIIAKPKHSFMTLVVQRLSSAHRWYILPYLNAMLATGPVYLSARYWTFKNRQDILVLKDTKSFLAHKTGASWHEVDGKIIWWVFMNRTLHMKWTAVGVGAILLLVLVKIIIRKRRSKTLAHRHPL